MFQYPNQNEVLKLNTDRENKLLNVGKNICFVIFNSKGYGSEKIGVIKGICLNGDYSVLAGGRTFAVSEYSYIY